MHNLKYFLIVLLLPLLMVGCEELINENSETPPPTASENEDSPTQNQNSSPSSESEISQTQDSSSSPELESDDSQTQEPPSSFELENDDLLEILGNIAEGIEESYFETFSCMSGFYEGSHSFSSWWFSEEAPYTLEINDGINEDGDFETIFFIINTETEDSFCALSTSPLTSNRIPDFYENQFLSGRNMEFHGKIEALESISHINLSSDINSSECTLNKIVSELSWRPDLSFYPELSETQIQRPYQELKSECLELSTTPL